QFFYFRVNTVTVNIFGVILLSYPLGHLMARWLPQKRIGFHWPFRFLFPKNHFLGGSLNPGPFNVKEQTLIAIAASTAIFPAYAIDIIAVQRLFYGDHRDPEHPKPDGNTNIGPLGSFLLLWTTQCLGFGMAGVLRQWLVYPSGSWWPYNLVVANLLHTFHAVSSQTLTSSRLALFKKLVLLFLLYELLPTFFAPLLQSVALLCIFAGGPSGALGNPGAFPPAGVSPIEKAPMITQMGSTFRATGGGGVFALSLDWQSISVTAPMYTPLWAELNLLIPNILFVWIFVPLIFK
ncbi:hypothetical protein HK102_011187, partial [Quaeritorhiza haematococci]